MAKAGIFVSILILILVITPCRIMEGAEYVHVKVIGCERIPEDELIGNAHLDRIPPGEGAYEEISRNITGYYQSRGFLIASVSSATIEGNSITVTIDEGRIGHIIFRKLDDLSLIRAKASFSLPGRIYHKPLLDEELSKLSKKIGCKEFKVDLIPTPDYDRSPFQIDGILRLPIIGEAFAGRKSSVTEIHPRYNLKITPVSYSPIEAESRKGGFAFSVNFFYLGIRPEASYSLPSLILNDDIAKISVDGGISYLSDYNLKNPPSVGYIAGEFMYGLPSISGIVRPKGIVNAYYSHATRPDIGLSSYDYILLGETLEPTIYPLEQLRIYPGIGAEKTFLRDCDFDEDTSIGRDKTEGTHIWYVTSAKVVLDRFFGFIHPALRRSVSLTGKAYFNHTTFQSLSADLEGDYVTSADSVLSFNVTAESLTGDVPFYREQSVSGGAFRGFPGRGFYTCRIVKWEQEFRTSIYRDRLYAGPFLDLTAFKGSGYDLKGRQVGICGGGALHIVFFDQFEFSFFAGRDHLFSSSKSGMVFNFGIEKK